MAADQACDARSPWQGKDIEAKEEVKRKELAPSMIFRLLFAITWSVGWKESARKVTSVF